MVQHAKLNKIPIVSLYDDILSYQTFADSNLDEGLCFAVGSKLTGIEEFKIDSQVEVATNILAIFGTDTVQGKFTTQLYLREALRSHLKVGHWATEPTGTLLGADIGYARTYLDLPEQSIQAYEKLLVSEFAKKYDLLITGGQNSMVYLPPGGSIEQNVSTSIYRTFVPRYVVLTVAVDTPLDRVQESIDYLQQLAQEQNAKTTVLALAMMTGRKIRGSRWTETYFSDVEQENIQQAKMIFKNEFGLPTCIVPDEVDKLAELVSQEVMTP